MTSWPSEPEILSYIEKSNAIAPDELWEGGVEDQRKAYALICAAFRQDRPVDMEVRDLSMDLGDRIIALRHYKPGRRISDGLILYFHGGGFVVGDLDSHDDICADLSDRTGTALLAVDYRLAPEHLYPAALEDCVAAVGWARMHAAAMEIDPQTIVVAGDSAGAKLSAGVTHRLRDGVGDQVQGQVLIYGAFGGDMNQGSYVEHANAPMLTTAACKVYFDLYSGSGQIPIDHYMKPLTACEFGSGVRPAARRFLRLCRKAQVCGCAGNAEA